jgi:hypothetical protein
MTPGAARWLMMHLHQCSISLAVSLCLAPAAYATSVTPKTLLIYYSYPSSINGTYTVTGAAAELGQYDYVVLGDLLEETSHPDHANTVAIIADPAMANTTVFGYIDLGVTSENLPLSEIQARVDEWQATGAAGIFFDLFGYDYGTPRARQNAAVDYAHGKGMPVVANAWVPADAFGTTSNPYNPSGTSTSLNASDFYLAESYQIMLDQFASESDWRTKADALKTFQDAIGFKIFSVTTTDSGGSYDQNKFFYAWYSALLDGHEATGWGEYIYSALSASAPFRMRPNVDPGSSFTGNIVAASPLFTRDTNLGTAFVNTSTHAFGWTPLPITEFIPGGRSRQDCTLEWFATPVPPAGANGLPKTRIECTDDDPSCDFGSAGDMTCTFHVAVCLNVTDSRFPCAPTDVAQLRIGQPPARQRLVADVMNRAALETALVGVAGHVQGQCTSRGPQHGLPCQTSSACDSAAAQGDGVCRSVVAIGPPLDATDQCTAPAAISVPLRHTAGGLKAARKTLQLKATPSNDPSTGMPRRGDSDRLTLICHPHP